MDTLLKFQSYLEKQTLLCLTLYAENNKKEDLDDYYEYNRMYVDNFIKIKKNDLEPNWVRFAEIMIQLKFEVDT